MATQIYHTDAVRAEEKKKKNVEVSERPRAHSSSRAALHPSRAASSRTQASEALLPLLFASQADAAWKMFGVVGGAGAVGLYIAAGPANRSRTVCSLYALVYPYHPPLPHPWPGHSFPADCVPEYSRIPLYSHARGTVSSSLAWPLVPVSQLNFGTSPRPASRFQMCWAE